MNNILIVSTIVYFILNIGLAFVVYNAFNNSKDPRSKPLAITLTFFALVAGMLIVIGYWSGMLFGLIFKSVGKLFTKSKSDEVDVKKIDTELNEYECICEANGNGHQISGVCHIHNTEYL